MKLLFTKFKFNSNIMDYADLVQLLTEQNYNTKFIQKPITDNLKVHSIFIKPDAEVTYLLESPKAEDLYNSAGYGCADYKEIDFQQALDELNYVAAANPVQRIESGVRTSQTQQNKKVKYITIDKTNKIITIKKKQIEVISYNKQSKILNIKTKSKEYTKFMELSDYIDFIDSINS